MNFSNSIKILILLVCLQCSPVGKTTDEIKLFNTKKPQLEIKFMHLLFYKITRLRLFLVQLILILTR